MDRKSKQKIGCVLAALVLILGIHVLFAVSAEYEEKLRIQQLQELQIIYPEIEEELTENFLFYSEQFLKNDRIIFFILSLLIIFVLTVLYLFHQKLLEQKQKQEENERRLFYEQLQNFQKGNYDRLSGYGMEEDGDWSKIHEKLHEVGLFMSDMKKRLREEENSTKALITDISHQLKTPLAAIRMSHELAEEETLSMEEQKSFREVETREIQKLEELLEELVKLSRLENHMIQIKLQKNSLKQTISEAVEQIFIKAYEKQVEIAVEMEGDMVIWHDRKWTAEALANVLDNAVKYSENGTTITIRVQPLATNVLIEVEDEGMGILEDELHKIFHRFYRGSQAKNEVKEGAGVGLYLARSILEQQGGTIIAKKRAVKGTVFKILLRLD